MRLHSTEISGFWQIGAAAVLLSLCIAPYQPAHAAPGKTAAAPTPTPTPPAMPLPATALLAVIPPTPATLSDIQHGTLPETWSTGGPRCMEMPEWQVHEYNADLYLMRQSGCTDYEKPFVFLMFGTERALLLDTGSRKGNIAPQVQLMVHRWLTRNHREAIPLIIVHTHAHGDHIAGDSPLQSLNDPAIPITFVAATVEATQKFYGIKHWPEDPGMVDLGNRIIDVLGIPGHEPAGVALYDRQTAILFTGDSVYPGRLYVRDFPTYEKSNERLVRFTDTRPVAHIIGNHIEQTRTPYLDYPTGTLYQPDEHALALPRGVLLEIQGGLAAMHQKMRRVAFRDFSLWPSWGEYRDTPEDHASYERTQKQQLDHMWDQAAP